MHRISRQMSISLQPELYKKAMLLAKQEVRSKSELVREALRYYIARQDLARETRKKLAANLDKKGIRTLEDVDRMIHEARA